MKDEGLNKSNTEINRWQFKVTHFENNTLMTIYKKRNSSLTFSIYNYNYNNKNHFNAISMLGSTFGFLTSGSFGNNPEYHQFFNPSFSYPPLHTTSTPFKVAHTCNTLTSS